MSDTFDYEKAIEVAENAEAILDIFKSTQLAHGVEVTVDSEKSEPAVFVVGIEDLLATGIHLCASKRTHLKDYPYEVFGYIGIVKFYTLANKEDLKKFGISI